MSKELFGDSKILVSLDTETADRWDDALMFSIGAVGAPIDEAISFQQLCDNALFIKLKAKEQRVVYNRQTSPSTIQWWKEQSTEAKAKSIVPTDADVSITEIPALLSQWMDDNEFDFKTCEYADRNLFDWNKLQHIYEVNLDTKIPWNYHNQSDFSSIFKAWGADRYAGIHTRDIPPRFGFVYHNPVHDAALDWLRMQHLMVTRGIIEFPENYIFNGLFYEVR